MSHGRRRLGAAEAARVGRGGRVGPRVEDRTDGHLTEGRVKASPLARRIAAPATALILATLAG